MKGKSNSPRIKICLNCQKEFIDDTAGHNKDFCSHGCWEEKYNRENSVKIKLQQKNRDLRRRQKYKLQCLIHYGGNPPKCTCCGETIYKFLTLDHINQNNKPDKLGKKRGANYVWIVKNNFPEIFRVLCYNCNCGREQNNGICPHKNIPSKSPQCLNSSLSLN